MALILIADDSDDLVTELEHALRKLGHEVRAVSDGTSLVEEARRIKPDLVISDLMMPRATGLSAYQALRADPSLPRMPFLFITGASEALARQSLPPESGVRLLIKPLGLDDIRRAVLELLAPSPSERGA